MLKISDIVKSVEAINLDTLELKSLTKDQCGFSSKHSIFKRDKNTWFVGIINKG